MPGSRSAEAAREALFDDDFQVTDPDDPSPTVAEPLLRQAIAADPGDTTSTLLLASVLARQLTGLYFHELWPEAIEAREAELGRLLAPLADTEAAAARLVLAVEAAEDWRDTAEADLPVAEELRRAHDGLTKPVDLFAWGYDWYELDFAVMSDNNGDIGHHTWLGTDAARLRRALDAVLSRDESERIFHDLPGELLSLSHFVDGALAVTVDLRPHLLESDARTHRVDWAAVTIPELTGTPLPIGHPIDGSQPFVGGIHYGANPGPG